MPTLSPSFNSVVIVNVKGPLVLICYMSVSTLKPFSCVLFCRLYVEDGNCLVLRLFLKLEQNCRYAAIRPISSENWVQSQ